MANTLPIGDTAAVSDTTPQDSPVWPPASGLPPQDQPAAAQPATTAPPNPPRPTVPPTRWGILGDVKRGQGWVLAEREVVNLVMGNARLDLRAATLSAPETTIVIQGMMCDAKIIVPDTWRVECDGTAIMGEFEVKSDAPAAPMPTGGPVVRVRGGVFMGNVKMYRTPAPVGEGGFADDGIAGWKARRRRRTEG